jgi:hypothetical protein
VGQGREAGECADSYDLQIHESIHCRMGILQAHPHGRGLLKVLGFELNPDETGFSISDVIEIAIEETKEQVLQRRQDDGRKND